MKNSCVSSTMPLRVALLSVQPQHVERIVTGEKLLEFRRRWTSLPVDALVVYSSSPIQKIMLSARVASVICGSPTFLWEMARKKGGGLTRRELYDYFSGIAKGFAIELADVLRFGDGIDPWRLFRGFQAPQSFRYLRLTEYQHILAKAA